MLCETAIRERVRVTTSSRELKKRPEFSFPPRSNENDLQTVPGKKGTLK